MLKNRRSAVLGLALFAGLGAFGIWTEISSQHNPASQAPRHSRDNAQTDIDPRTSEERIADYTLWLERFTGLLVIVSAVQIAFLISADKTARTAADAAKTAADAALAALDRPWLYLEIPRVDNFALAPNKVMPIAHIQFTN